VTTRALKPQRWGLIWAACTDTGQGKVADKLLRQARRSAKRCEERTRAGRQDLAVRALRQAVDFASAARALGFYDEFIDARLRTAGAPLLITIEGP
jgi:hypothetical protein